MVNNCDLKPVIFLKKKKKKEAASMDSSDAFDQLKEIIKK